MVSPRKTDVMLAKRAEQHKKADVEMVPARRVELLKRAAAMARVAPARRAAVELLKRADTACSVAHHKRAAAVLLKRVDAELLRRVAVTVVLAKRAAVVPLKREAAAQLKRAAIAARRVDITAPRCSLA